MNYRKTHRQLHYVDIDMILLVVNPFIVDMIVWTAVAGFSMTSHKILLTESTSSGERDSVRLTADPDTDVSRIVLLANVT